MFLKDPCGICCIAVTYAAVFYSDYVVIYWLINKSVSPVIVDSSLWGSFNLIVFNLIICLLCGSHFRAVFSDPGHLPFSTSTKHDLFNSSQIGCEYVDWTLCTRCEIYRPPRAHHCRICQRCIRRMDHHCPWINNCVGERNQKYFLQFLIYVGVLSTYSIALIAFTWLSDCDSCLRDDVPTRQRKIMHSLILLLISALFGMFVVAILIDQLYAIVNDESTMELVKTDGIYRPNKPKMALLREVFGRGHPVLWLLPCMSTRRKFDAPLMNYSV